MAEFRCAGCQHRLGELYERDGLTGYVASRVLQVRAGRVECKCPRCGAFTPAPFTLARRSRSQEPSAPTHPSAERIDVRSA